MISNYDKPEYKEIPKEKNFETYFSAILPLFGEHFDTWIKAFSIKLKYPKKLAECDSIISRYIDEWKTLTEYSNHKIVIHVFKMLYSVQKDLDFTVLDNYDKNIILWTCLLHDIAKRGTPICLQRDYIHPFQGARLVLHIFKRLGFFDCKKEIMESWDDIFEKATTKDKKGEECHDNSKLVEIYRILSEILPENCLEKDVIVLVLLHQSLPSLPEFDYHIVLSPLYEEIPKYFSKRLLMLMKLIIKHDSLSYLIGGEFWEIKNVSDKFDAIINDILKNTTWT